MKKIARYLSIFCLFVLAACSGEETTPAYVGVRHGEATLAPNSVVVSASEAANSVLKDDVLTLTKPQGKLYKVGDVIIFDSAGGHLLKVVSVDETPTSYVYKVSRASLTDSFSELSVSFAGDLSPQDLGETFDTGDPGIELAWKAIAPAQAGSTGQFQKVSTDTNVLQLRFKKVGAEVGSGIEIDGTTEFKLNPDFSLDLKKVPGQTLPSLGMSAVITPDLRSSISVSSKYGGKVSYILDKSFDLPAFKRIIVVPVFGVPTPVPFWIRPRITISGSVNGVAGSKFTTTNTYGVNGQVGFHLSPEKGVQQVSTLTNTSETNVSDVESEFGVNLTAPKVEISFAIYSFAGPSFDLGLETGIVGKNATKGEPAVEGVEVEAGIKVVANGGLKASLEFKDIDAVKKLLGDVSGEYTAFSVRLYEAPLLTRQWFFPYTGLAGVVVRDNGNVPDDIFEVLLDDVVIGRTSKGRSGQFRLKNLRPGQRVLTLKTVEDDAPPGTYEVTLNEGMTFVGGETVKSGYLSLGSTVDFLVNVPIP